MSKIKFLYYKINFTIAINFLLILYAFLVPTLKYINKPLAVFILFLWILEGNFKYKYKILKSSKVVVFFFLFLLFNYISLFWTDNLRDSLRYLEKYWLYLPMLFIFTSIKLEYIKYLIFAFLAGMFISEILTYGIYFDLWSTPYNDTHHGTPTAFMSHLAYSMFLAFTSLIVLNKLLFTNSKKYKTFLIFYFLFIFGNLVISGGRTGLLSFVVALILYLIIYNLKNIKFLAISLVGVSLLFYLSYNYVSLFKHRINQAKNDIVKLSNGNIYSSFGHRAGLLIVGFELFKEKPILGWGIKDNFEAIKIITKRDDLKYLAPVYNLNTVQHHFHNQYMIYLTQTGLVGLILFLLIFYNLNRLKIEDEEISNIKFLLIVTLMIGLVSTELFHQMHPIGLFALFSGIFLAQNRYESLKKAKDKQ